MAGSFAAEAQVPADAQLCRAAILGAEASRHIPDAFLSAIARVESGRQLGGTVQAWPWTINAEGQGAFFASKAEAIAAVRTLQARGVRSIDVGCMQVNLQHHPEAFVSLEEAFDPQANATYAAGLLVSLFGQFGSWPLAAAAYHSQTPGIGAAYEKQVLAAWAVPDRQAALPRADQARAARLAMAVTAQARAARPGGMAEPGSIASGTNLNSPDPSSLRPGGAAAEAAQTAGTPSFGRTLSVLATEQPHPMGARGAGKTLDAYRAVPVRLALRPPAFPG